MSNKYLAPKWTMEKLLAEQKRIFSDPAYKNPDTKSIHLLTKPAEEKIEQIGFAIRALMKEARA